VFDPERDHDEGVRPFYRRLAAVTLVTGAVCVAMWPSVSGFAAGPDRDIGCVAIRDGWHAEVPAPSASDVAAARAAFPPPPTPAQASDPEFMKGWRAKLQVAQQNPATVRANARLTWLAGRGACVPESRHRLILSGAVLGGLVLATLGAALAIRAHTAAQRRRIAAFA
jgi:hypothetical protein